MKLIYTYNMNRSYQLMAGFVVAIVATAVWLWPNSVTNYPGEGEAVVALERWIL